MDHGHGCASAENYRGVYVALGIAIQLICLTCPSQPSVICILLFLHCYCNKSVIGGYASPSMLKD